MGGFVAAVLACAVVLATGAASLHANQWPSLFRGVIVAENPVGARVVSVQEASQAYMADLRPEDIIVRLGTTQVRSIDEFAKLSQALKGRTHNATVLVLRNGKPQQVFIHLYSYPILRVWAVAFIPDHDLRFAMPEIGLDYWRRLGRGFEEAGNLDEALTAYLNGLHNVPTDTATAFRVAQLSAEVGRRRLKDEGIAEGIAALRQGFVMMERLFDYPLDEDQLRAIRDQLRQTLSALRGVQVRPTASP